MHKNLLNQISTACVHMALSMGVLSATGAAPSYYRTRKGIYGSGPHQYRADPGMKPLSATTLSNAKQSRKVKDSRSTNLSDFHFEKRNPVRELVIVDSDVQNKHLILGQIKPGLDVVEVKPEVAGIEAITSILRNYTRLDAVHIVSHADAGILYIGGQKVDQYALEQHIATFSVMNDAIREGGDLLLYGCNLAEGESGDQFLNLIRGNTHVDVAASLNKTGNAQYGGDWELEVRKGDIEAVLLPGSIALKDFTGTLQFTGTIDFSQVKNAGDYQTLDPAVNAEVWESSAKNHVLIVDGTTGPTYTFGNYVSFGAYYAETAVVLRFAENETFDPKSVKLFNWSGTTCRYTITSDKGGSVTTGVLSASEGSETIDISSLPAETSTLTITSNGAFWGAVDNLAVENMQVAGSNTPPTSSNVTFTGTLKTGQTLTGDYDYSDTDSDPESGSTFRWYRSDDASGTNKTVIGGATAKTYTLTSADAGKYISFEVTPNDGTDAGTAVESSRQGPVTIPAPEIQVKGNSTVIADGDNTPASGDHTDFGSTAAAGGTVSRTFTIENTGDAALTLTDNGPGFVTIAGTNAADFDITSQPGGTIAAGGSSTFTVQFDPGAIGERTATITINSNDPNETAFDFSVKGTGLNTAPVITSNGGGANASVNVAENTTAVTTVTATDADGNTSTFSISGGADAALFSIDENTGALNFDAAPDFENPSDADPDGVYEVEVTAGDGKGGSDIQVLSVTVTDIDDVTPVITANEGAIVMQGASISIGSTELQADDEDTNNDNLVYVVTNGPTNGQLELITAPGVSIPSFTQVQLNADQIIYVHNGSNTDSDSFIFVLQDGAGNNLAEQTFEISVTLITNINNAEGHFDFETYPNPATDNLTFEFGNTGSREVVILNSQGVEVLSFSSVDEMININVSSLPAGLYHVSLKSERGISVSKFIKR